MTPTYPKLIQSPVDGVLQTTMNLFNRREDVLYYEIGVYNDKWEPLPFATKSRLIRLQYAHSVNIDVYIREKDKNTARYICTTSLIEKDKAAESNISSRICSKIK